MESNEKILERRSIRQKESDKKVPVHGSSSLYDQIDQKVLCCICGIKCIDSILVKDKVLRFIETLNDFFEKDEIPEGVLTSESHACLQCHNLLNKIIQLLDEVKKQKAKLKHFIVNRHKSKANQFNRDRIVKSGIQDQKFSCEICGKEFTRKASLLEHAARHKGIRDRECKVCNSCWTSFWLSLHVYLL